jgi:hypothetical protein
MLRLNLHYSRHVDVNSTLKGARQAISSDIGLQLVVSFGPDISDLDSR